MVSLQEPNAMRNAPLLQGGVTYSPISHRRMEFLQFSYDIADCSFDISQFDLEICGINGIINL